MAAPGDDAPERALAVYAHPDDPEVSCGGTLARWAAAGAEVRLVICTQGEKGALDASVDPGQLADTRASEARAAAEVLGLAGVELLGYPDGELDNTVELRGRLVGLLREVRPEIVVCPDPTAVFFGTGYVNHHDHRSVGWATLDACAPAAASPLYFPDAGEPHQVASIWLSGTLEPDVWVDIDDVLDVKAKALACHRTQVGDGTWVGDMVRQRAQDAAAGSRAGSGAAGTPPRHAEGFRRLVF